MDFPKSPIVCETMTNLHCLRQFEKMGATTPRFRAQLDSTVKIHEEMLRLEPAGSEQMRKNGGELLKVLEDHWAKLFPTFSDAITFYTRVETMTFVIKSKLLEDYLDDSTGHHLSSTFAAFGMVKGDSTDRERAAKELCVKIEQLDSHYEACVGNILYELIIDKVHIERKLKALADRNGQPGSDIQPLVDSCQWTDLATALCKDRILIDIVLSPGQKTRHVNRAIDRLQKKYFKSFKNPSSFVLSSHAEALSAAATRRANDSASLGAPPPYSDLIDDQTPANEKEKSDH